MAWVVPRVEAGYNTSTAALRVLRGGGKGTQCPGVYLHHLVPGGYKYEDLALQVLGVSRIRTIKYGFESRGTSLARTSSNSKLQARPLVREGATKITNPQLSKENFKEKEKLVAGPR
jgi:hypothetical protein